MKSVNPQVHAGKAMRLGASVTCLLVILVLSGCSVPKPNWDPAKHTEPTGPLIMAPGDEVQVRFIGAQELDVIQTVRRDGKITLDLVGEIEAAGVTSEQLKWKLWEEYKSQLQLSEVSVSVTSLAPIFVGGAVRDPGRVDIDRPMTVLQAISQSGGFNLREAQTKSVFVLRNRGMTREAYVINLKPTLKGDPGYPFYLKSMDIVFVPRKGVVLVNEWIDQYISRMLPSIPLRVVPIE